MSLEIRAALAEEVEAFYPEPLPHTVRALVALRDGEVLGVGGYYLQNGVAIAFTDWREGLSKREVLRCGRALMAKLEALPFEVHIAAPLTGAAAHFGFAPVPGRPEIWRLEK